jgi:hypothetical protein
MGAMRRTLRSCLRSLLVLGLAVAVPACGTPQDDALPSDTAVLLTRHRELGDAGQWDEAGRVLERLSDLAESADATSTDRERAAEAWRNHAVDGIRADQPQWIAQAVAALASLAGKPNASTDLERTYMDALVKAADYAWEHDDADSAARLLYDIEDLARAEPDAPERRWMRALAWTRAFRAGVESRDDSLTARSLDRLDDLSRAKDATRAERQAYLDVLATGQRLVLLDDLTDDAAALRARAALLIDAGGAAPAEVAVLVRMLAEAAVQDAGQGGDDAIVLLDEAMRRCEGLGGEPAARAALGAWLDARRYLVHRARHETAQAQALLARLEAAAAREDAGSEALDAVSRAWMAAVRDAPTPGDRARILEAFEQLGRRDAASIEVLVNLGEAQVGAAQRARADGQEDEAQRHIARLRAGAASAAHPIVRARLADLLATAEAGAAIPASDLPR